MKRSLFFLASLVVLILTVHAGVTAQDLSNASPDSAKADAAARPRGSDKALTSEVEMLKRRIDELESQNRAMMQLLAEIKGKLDAPTRASIATARQPDAVAPPSAQARMADGRISTIARVDASPGSKPAPAADSRSSTVDPPSASAQAKPPAAGDQPRWSELIGEGNKFKFYGFLRLDLDIDSQRPNTPQTPFFITSADPRIGKPDAGNFSMHPRLTRFGVDYTGPQVRGLGDGKLSGKLELDFENGGTESRQIIRIRHAYLKMNWRDFSILGGQTWDVFSPLLPTVNNDTTMWNAGNVGDRRPQFRVSYEPKVGRGQWSLAGAAGLTGAIDSQDLDANSFRDGEESGRPDVQARVGYSHALWVKDQSAGVAVSGFYGWLNTSRPVTAAARTSFRAQMLNIDYTLPLASRVSLRGEGWWGRNMSDIRGGAGQGLNLTTGREIRGRGGWSELSVKPSRYYAFHPGFTTDDPVDEDLPVGGRTRNQAFYLGNRITPGGSFLIGMDYLRWKTNYKGFLRGLDNRVNLFFQYSF
jgi:hypothetical protein